MVQFQNNIDAKTMSLCLSYRTEFTIISLKNLGVRLCNIISYPLSEGKQIVKIIECVYKWIYQEKSNIFAQM